MAGSSAPGLIAPRPPAAPGLSCHPSQRRRWFPLRAAAVWHSQTCEMMMEERRPLSHQSLSPSPLPPSPSRRPYARLNSGPGGSDGDGCLLRAGDPSSPPPLPDPSRPSAGSTWRGLLRPEIQKKRAGFRVQSHPRRFLPEFPFMWLIFLLLSRRSLHYLGGAHPALPILILARLAEKGARISGTRHAVWLMKQRRVWSEGRYAGAISRLKT